MVKVGQIYELPLSQSRFVVDKIEQSEGFDRRLDWCYCLFNDGYRDRLWRMGVEKLKLITEYPTWQEAINSKEFKE